MLKNPSANAGTKELQVRSLGQAESLEEEMATHSSILAWEIPRTEEPGETQSIGSQRIRCDSYTQSTHTLTPLDETRRPDSGYSRAFSSTSSDV